jgi:hypothetical protein
LGQKLGLVPSRNAKKDRELNNMEDQLTMVGGRCLKFLAQCLSEFQEEEPNRLHPQP